MSFLNIKILYNEKQNLDLIIVTNDIMIGMTAPPDASGIIRLFLNGFPHKKYILVNSLH